MDSAWCCAARQRPPPADSPTERTLDQRQYILEMYHHIHAKYAIDLRASYSCYWPCCSNCVLTPRPANLTLGAEACLQGCPCPTTITLPIRCRFDSLTPPLWPRTEPTEHLSSTNGTGHNLFCLLEGLEGGVQTRRAATCQEQPTALGTSQWISEREQAASRSSLRSNPHLLVAQPWALPSPGLVACFHRLLTPA